MANIETWFEQDLMNPVTVRNVGSIFSQDSLGNLIGVRVKKDGEDYILSGSVNGYCILADGSTVPVIGTRSGNTASIILPASAYSVTGPIAIAIKLTDGNAITTLAACVGIVTRSRTGVQIDPGQTVTDWTNQIAAALQEVIDTSAAQDVKINDLKSAINDSLNYLSTNGLNLFNPARSKDNAYINASGTEVSKSNFSHSEMIPIKANTTAYISRGLGSNSYPTLLQFDASGNLLSNGTKTQSRTDAFSITTESTAAYLVYNYATAQAGNIMISYTDTAYEAFKLIGSGNVTKYSINSPNIIFYDGTNLLSKSNIRLFTNKKIIEFTPPVNVGSGAYLYFNAETETLFASSNMETGINKYLICALNGNEYHKNNVFSNFINRYPIEYDPLNRTVTIIKGNGTIYHQGTYYSTGSGSVTLEADNDHFVLYYSVSDSSFHVTSSYNNINNDDIVIMEASHGAYSSLSQIKVINSPFAKSGVSFYTFGDSLTWYDGNEFTWGPHEGETCVGYQSYLQKINRMILETNYGQSGKTTPQICARLISNVSNISDHSFVFLMGGDNDDRLAVDVGSLHAVGSNFDDTTIYGALQKAVETLLASKPTVRLILMTEPIGWTSKNDVMYRVDSDIPDAYRNVAKLYGLPLIDLWNVAGVNEFTRATYFCDPLPVSEGGTNRSYMYHPNNDGWKRIATYICDEVLKL